jgi:hypothetical protein
MAQASTISPCPPSLGQAVRLQETDLQSQRPRGSRPDIMKGDSWYLLKNVTLLRLTYQIKLLTFGAGQEGAHLVIRVPQQCRLSSDLRTFLADQSEVVSIDWAS